MWHYLPALLAAVLGGAAIVVTVYYINRERIREVARETAKEKNLEVFSAKIKSITKSGAYEVVDVGLHNANDLEQLVLEVKGQSISGDISEGDKIYI